MLADLSERHGPVSDMFRVPTTAAQWDEYRLSDDQVEFFHKNGYLAGVRLAER